MARKNQSAEMKNLQERIVALENALRWYVENDDTMEGGKWEDLNQFWIDGKRQAQKLLGIPTYTD